MNASKFRSTAIAGAALLAATLAFALPLRAQNISGKQNQADAIPSPREALNGRLFFSREQRLRLDRLRTGGDMSAEQIAVEPRASGINGFVKRSDGETAVWVDGRVSSIPPNELENITPSVVGGSANSLRVSMALAPLPIAIKATVAKPAAKRVRKASAVTRARSSAPKRN